MKRKRGTRRSLDSMNFSESPVSRASFLTTACLSEAGSSDPLVSARLYSLNANFSDSATAFASGPDCRSAGRRLWYHAVDV